MPAPDASTPARDAIDAFLRHLADRDLSATTRRIRKTYLNESLPHAQQSATADDAEGAEQGTRPGDGPAGPPLTAGDLMDGDRAAAWLADAAAGKTRTRNSSRGPEAAAYPNSMRVRIDSVNAFAEFLGEAARLDRQARARRQHLQPGGHRGPAARPDGQAPDPRQRDDRAAHRRRRRAGGRHRARRPGASGT